jgi:hypothetical protein
MIKLEDSLESEEIIGRDSAHWSSSRGKADIVGIKMNL